VRGDVECFNAPHLSPLPRRGEDDRQFKGKTTDVTG